MIFKLLIVKLLIMRLVTVVFVLFPLFFCALMDSKGQETGNASIDNSTIRMEDYEIQYPNHVIVIVDRSGSNKDKFRTCFANKINRYLRSIIYDNLQLDDKDYISFVSFGLDRERPSMQRFIEIDENVYADLEQYPGAAAISGYGFTYEKLDLGLERINRLFNNPGFNYNYFFRKNYGGITLAEEMAVGFLKNDNIKVNNTYIITISDGEFNASDPVYEIEIFKQKPVPGIEQAEKTIELLNEYYNISRMDVVTNNCHINLKVSKLNSKLLSSFNINRLVDFKDINENIPYHRIPDGYEIGGEIEFIDNDELSVYKCYINLYNSNDKIIATKVLKNPKGKFNVTLDQIFPEKTDFNYITFDFDVALKDSVYNASIMSSALLPDDVRGNFRNQITCYYDNEGKILAVFPMPNFMYSVSSSIVGNDASSSILFWNILILTILGVILVILFFKYLKRHRVNNDANEVQIN